MEVEGICISKILVPKQSKDQVQYKDKVDKDVMNERCSKGNGNVPAKKGKTHGRPRCGSTQNYMEIWEKLKSGRI